MIFQLGVCEVAGPDDRAYSAFVCSRAGVIGRFSDFDGGSISGTCELFLALLTGRPSLDTVTLPCPQLAAFAALLDAVEEDKDERALALLTAATASRYFGFAEIWAMRLAAPIG